MITLDYSQSTGRLMMQVPFKQNHIIKQMSGYRWLKRTKLWSVPAIRSNIEFLQGLGKGEVLWTPGALIALQDLEDSRPRTEGISFPAWYNYKTEPFTKQREAIETSYGRPEFAYFMEMGTGKTKVWIDVITALFLESKIDRVIVVCPVSVQDNWPDEIDIHSPIENNIHVYRPQKHKKYDKWLDTVSKDKDKLPWLIVGMESLSQGRAGSTMFDFSMTGKLYMLVDESSWIKNEDAARTQKCINAGRNAIYRSIGTGTEITKGPLDLYSQFEFLNTHIFGMGDYYSFRNRYTIMGGFENKEIVAYTNLDEMVETMAPFVFQASLKEVAPEIKEPIYQIRHVTASAEQKDLLKQIAKGHAVINDIDIEVRNVLEKMLRMQQIVNGFYTEYMPDPLSGKKKGVTHSLKSNPKLEEFRKVRGELSTQGIVWSFFRHTLAQLIEEFDGDCVQYYGGIKVADRPAQRYAFQAGEKEWMVANQTTGGIGLTLTAGKVNIYFDNTFKADDRWQSEKRTLRIGQKDYVHYIDIVMQGTIDELKMESLKAKKEIADYVKEQIRLMGSQSLLDSLVGTA